MTIPLYIIFHILDYIKLKNKISFIVLNKDIYNYIFNANTLNNIIITNNITIPKLKIKKADKGKNEQVLLNNHIIKYISNKMYRLCDECNLFYAPKRELYNMRICTDCNDLPQYKLITKTRAIKQYKLKETQLETLDSIKRDNPHYKCSAPMTLYREIDVIALCHKL